MQTSIHYSLKQCLAPGTSYVQDNRCRRIPGLASTIPKRPVMCAIVFGHDIFQKRAEERTEMQGKNCIAKALCEFAQRPAYLSTSHHAFVYPHLGQILNIPSVQHDLPKDIARVIGVQLWKPPVCCLTGTRYVAAYARHECLTAGPVRLHCEASS